MAAQEVPAGYPESYGDTIAAGIEQGEVLIYTNLSEANIGPLVDAFEAAYPGIDVQSLEMGPAEAFSRYLAETGTGIPSADLIIANSIADWIQASAEGIVVEYASPEIVNLPDWSHPAPGLFTLSADPMVMIYNRITVPEELQASSMEEYFANIVDHPDLFDGKVGTYDGRYAFGGAINYAFAQEHGDAAWEWFEAAGPSVLPGGGAGGMIERTVSGELNSSFFVSGPVVFNRMEDGLGEILAWTFPSDGTPLFPRGMGISAEAPHPDAARLFLDFALSEPGQNAVVAGSLTAYRPGVVAEGDLAFSVDEVIDAVGGEENLIVIDYDQQMVTDSEAFSARWGAAFNM
jgi:iron(III) transport system substrate-binding protein